MATFTRRVGKRGVRWTARVRLRGQVKTDTFGSKAAAEAWARAQEGAIETGTYRAAIPGKALILADAVDSMLADRQRLRLPPGSTFDNALKRFKRDLGLEPVGAIDWLQFAKDRIAAGVGGSTVAGDLAYATSVLAHAAERDPTVDPKAPGRARTALQKAGMQMTSRQRKRRITDAEIEALLACCDHCAKAACGDHTTGKRSAVSTHVFSDFISSLWDTRVLSRPNVSIGRPTIGGKAGRADSRACPLPEGATVLRTMIRVLQPRQAKRPTTGRMSAFRQDSNSRQAPI